MTTLERILQWANTLPPWKSDAVRRLLTQEALLEKDRSDVLSMLKAAHGLIDPLTPPPAPQRYGEQHISGAQASNRGLILRRLRDIQNVNALVPGQDLPFGHSGITAVYGENGAGKSGYARVLKRACRARDDGERILPDVFESAQPTAASATFAVTINGVDQDIPWTDGGPKPEELADVAVFDSKCARVILDEKNEASYLPYGASVFQDFVELLTNLRKKLEAERPAAELPLLSGVDPNSATGKFMDSLTSGTTTAQVDAATSWSEVQGHRLAEVTRMVAVAEGDNPQARATGLRRVSIRLETFREGIRAIEAQVSRTAMDRDVAAIEQANAARDALAKLVGDLAAEPLPGAGGEPWRLLYDAARKYSLDAFPSNSEAFGQAGRPCVLCMQPLSEEASERFARFRQFMEGEVKKQEAETKARLVALAKEQADTDWDLLSRSPGLLDELRDRDGALAAEVEAYTRAAKQIATGRRRAIESRRTDGLQPGADSSPRDALNALAVKLQSEATAIEQAMQPAELAKLKNEANELSARKALADQRPALVTHVDRLLTIARYDACIADTATTGISKEGKKTISDSLTPALREGLTAELDRLGADYVPLNLRASAERGETQHQLVLDKATIPSRTDLSDILSEGEQRVVAIAGFLAELSAGGHSGPIVLDDPVSSLDHRFRDRIAERLTQEGKNRQVIIFTHDIAFLLELKDRAADGPVPFSSQTVARIGSDVGHRMDGEPWQAKKVKECVEYLRQKLQECRNLHQTDQSKYNDQVTQVYGLLREAWERVVEENLLNGVVKCHGAEVQTLRLKQVQVTDDDYKIVDEGMSKCSKWMSGHRKAPAIDINRPPPEEVEQDINALAKFSKVIRTRGEQVGKARDEALKPPAAPQG